MPTSAFSSQGTQLKVKRSAVYALIPGVVGALIPPTIPAYDDITNLDSSGGYPERLPIGKDFADVQYDLIWDPANDIHGFLESASINQTLLDFEAVVSNSGGATYTWQAYVKWEPKLEHRKAGHVNMTLNVTGAIARIA